MFYKVLFTIEGALEVVASCEEDAQRIVEEMERATLLRKCDEYGFSTNPCEMGEEE